MDDPIVSNADHYRMLWENDFVRVLEYTDVPGDATTPHAHPNSVMVTLSSFRRTLISGERSRDVDASRPLRRGAGGGLGPPGATS